MCQEVASAIPGCQYVEIDQCGHFGFLERPDEINATLLEFFSSAGRQLSAQQAAPGTGSARWPGAVAVGRLT